jgi:hypothetical protein
MAKTIFCSGLDELDKLEQQAGGVKFKLFVPRAAVQFKTPFRVWSTSNGTNMVVIGTGDLIAVAKMLPGEPVPAGAITTQYFKS